MIIYGFLRRYMSVKTATFAATICYALMLTMIVIALSQLGADLRYANL